MGEFSVSPVNSRWDHVIEYVEFQAFCLEVFGREPYWSGPHNGSFVQVDVAIDGTDLDGAEELAAEIEAWRAVSPPEELDEWRVSSWYWDNSPKVSLDALLWQLATWGRIPFGRYLMLVRW